MKKKTVAVAFAIIMMLCVSACANPESGIAAEDSMVYKLTGVTPDTVVMTVDGNEITADLYCYWLSYSCAYVEDFITESMGAQFSWDYIMPDGSTAVEYIRKDSCDTVKLCAALENMASENGITLSESENAEIDAKFTSFAEQYGGKDKYLAKLDSLGLTEATYRRLCEEDYLYESLQAVYDTPGSALYQDDDFLLQYAKDNDFITADHILFANYDLATGLALSEEELAAKKAKAEEVLEKLKSCTDLEETFNSLADEYSDDKGRESNPFGYTFTKGEMTSGFEDAAYALKENELSEIVESEYGYHIILRKPLDSEAAISIIRKNYFDIMQMDRAKASDTVIEDALNSIDIARFYEGFCAAQEPV